MSGSAVRLTKPTSQVGYATATFAADAPAGTTLQAQIVTQRSISPPKSAVSVPTSEYWYITSFYLPAGMSPSPVNAVLNVYVNDIPQPLSVMESEIQQNVYNKLRLSPDQWIHLEPGSTFYETLTSTASASSAATVTIYQVFLRVPVAAAR
jgi:hypothetical protein